MTFKSAPEVEQKHRRDYFRRWHLKHRTRRLAERKARYRKNKAKEIAKSGAWQRANRNKTLEYQKAYRRRHPDRARRSWREYFKRNEQAVLSQKRLHRAKFYQENRAAVLAKNAAWRKANPAYDSAMSAKRRALKRKAVINLKAIQRWMKVVRSKPSVRCYYCGSEGNGRDAHFDHVIALSKGGPHCVSNLCVACGSCNLRKSSKTLRTWIAVGQQLLEL